RGRWTRAKANCVRLVAVLLAAASLPNTAGGAEPSRTSAPVVVIHDVLVDGRSQKLSPETPAQSGARSEAISGDHPETPAGWLPVRRHRDGRRAAHGFGGRAPVAAPEEGGRTGRGDIARRCRRPARGDQRG